MDENYKNMAELHIEPIAKMAFQSFQIQCDNLPDPVPNKYKCELNGYSELFTVKDSEGNTIHSTPLIIPYEPSQPKNIQQELIGILVREPLSSIIEWKMKLHGTEHVWKLDQVSEKAELIEVIQNG